MKLKAFTLALAFVVLNACQGPPPPQIRFGDIGFASERRELTSEITKVLIRHGLGNEVKVVQVEQHSALDGLLAQNFDVALFVDTPEVHGVPSKCSEVSHEAVALGPISDDEKASKVVRCDLLTRDLGVFNLVKQIKVSPEGLDQALQWKQSQKTSLMETALYYLHHSTGAFAYSRWMPQANAQNMKTVIAERLRR